MARRTRREIEIADHLWDCLARIAEDVGTDRGSVVNQAIYEFARRLNFVEPTTLQADPPGLVAPASKVGSPEPKVEPAPPKPMSAPAAAPAAAPPPRRTSAVKTLFIVDSGGEMHKVDKDTFIIGRSRTCDLVIASSKVSRQHGGVSRENGEFYIEDLGSANGVWKNGARIHKERVADGDEFMISEETLKFIFR